MQTMPQIRSSLDEHRHTTHTTIKEITIFTLSDMYIRTWHILNDRQNLHPCRRGREKKERVRFKKPNSANRLKAFLREIAPNDLQLDNHRNPIHALTHTYAQEVDGSIERYASTRNYIFYYILVHASKGAIGLGMGNW